MPDTKVVQSLEDSLAFFRDEKRSTELPRPEDWSDAVGLFKAGEAHFIWRDPQDGWHAYKLLEPNQINKSDVADIVREAYRGIFKRSRA